MTENEAIRELSYDNTAYGGKCTEQVRKVAIQALEEVQQYRAIEKRLADMFGDELSLENYVDMLEETLEDSIAEQDNPHIVKTRIVTMENVASLEAYRTIGTVEECQSAVEKQRTKRPIIINRSGRLTDFKCPCCGARRIVGIKARDEHCGDCGQRLDWSS